jgi:hypothetical protein
VQNSHYRNVSTDPLGDHILGNTALVYYLATVVNVHQRVRRVLVLYQTTDCSSYRASALLSSSTFRPLCNAIVLVVARHLYRVQMAHIFVLSDYAACFDLNSKGYSLWRNAVHWLCVTNTTFLPGGQRFWLQKVLHSGVHQGAYLVSTDVFALLGCYAELVCGCSPKSRDDLWIFKGHLSRLKMGPKGCSYKSVNSYQPTLCNIPEQRRFHSHRVGSLKYCLVYTIIVPTKWTSFY